MDFKKFTSIFVEVEDKPKTAPAPLQQGTPAQAISNNAVINPNFASVTPPAINGNVVGVVSDEFSKHFDEILDVSKVPGVGYGQFVKQLAVFDTLKGSMTESQRYDMALKSMQAQGINISKADILASVQKFIDILANDDVNLTKLVEQRKTEQIVSRQQDIETLNNQITDKQNQIQKLNEEIKVHQNDIAIKQGEITQQSTLIEQRQQNYKATWAVYNTHLTQDVQNINSYLQ